jgi:4-amino-4-deoxy-L-arabinose transferase-like glycosyltransferase
MALAHGLVCHTPKDSIGRRWLPLWHARLRSVLRPEVQPSFTGLQPYRAAADAQWVWLGYVLIAALLVFRLVYIAGDTIELSEDEAYQWLWSKHLALSYYSKPPLIAYTQFLGTALWGDTEFGVRFFSPVIAATLSVLMLRFLACQGHVRAGFWLVPLAATTPLLAVGSILMTIDPLSVLFWTAAMVSGWEAVQRDSTRHWLWTGLWMGLGFLSKYTALFQWLCWIVFFALWKPARVQLRRPGPWLALLVNLVCTLPVIIWNAQHGWITATHLYERGGLDAAWQPTLRFLGEFLGVEAGVLNPVFFVAMLWAMIAFWRSQRRDPLALFLFSMGAPLFLGYTIYTLRAHVLPNWIAPAVVPLFCLMALHWNARERAGARVIKGWLAAGLVLGLVAVVVLHDTDLVQKVAGQNLPVNLDPLRRVRGWKEGAAVVAQARTRLLAEGKPVFLIGDHYGVTGLLSFYLPEAKADVPDHPLVYFRSTDRPINQFYFWPGYTNRTGQNAIYVRDTKRKFQVPPRLLTEFASVEDLGLFEVRYRGRVLRQLQLFACRDLR